MITSFVELPEFAVPGTVIRGMRPLTDAWFKCDYPVPLGRDIAITGMIHKYKAQYTDYSKGKTYSIIYLSQDKINPYHIEPNKCIVPIYFREYNTRIVSCSLPVLSNAVLWIPGINFVLKNWMGLGGVISIIDLCDRIFQNCCDSGEGDPTDYIPRKLIDGLYEKCYGTLASIDLSQLTECMSCSYDPIENRTLLEDVLDKGARLQGQVPVQLRMILEIMNTSNLIKIMDPNHSFNPITSQVMNSSDGFAEMYEMIHKYDYQIPKYVSTCDPVEEMELFLWYSSIATTTDFSLSNPGGISWSTNLADLATGRETSIPEHEFGSMIGDSARSVIYHNYSQSMDVTMTCSYLEDVWMYDMQGELVAYIDLVWWILAAASGLVNEVMIQ